MKKDNKKTDSLCCCGGSCPSVEGLKKKIDSKIKELKDYTEKNPQKTRKIFISIALSFLAFLLLIVKKNKNKNVDLD